MMDIQWTVKRGNDPFKQHCLSHTPEEVCYENVFRVSVFEEAEVWVLRSRSDVGRRVDPGISSPLALYVRGKFIVVKQ